MQASLSLNDIPENFDIRSDLNKGKGVFSKCAFSEATLVFSEEPILSCQFPWNQDAGYKACDHCLRPLESAEENARSLCRDADIMLPLPDASIATLSPVTCDCQVVYCSDECKKAAYAKYHQALCAAPNTPRATALSRLKKVWKEMHYPPEEATVMLLMRVYGYIHLAEDKAEATSHFSHFVADAGNPAVVDKLLGKHKDEVAILARHIADCAAEFQLDVAPELLSLPGVLTGLSVLALNGQGIGTSALSHWYNSHSLSSDPDVVNMLNDYIDALYASIEQTVGLDFMNNEGMGLYQIQSKLNHSCEPNLELSFPSNNHRLTLTALCDIPAGTELTISYLDSCQLTRSRHSRQKMLREKHLFTCLCSKCEREAGEPDETSEEEDDENDDVSM